MSSRMSKSIQIVFASTAQAEEFIKIADTSPLDLTELKQRVKYPRSHGGLIAMSWAMPAGLAEIEWLILQGYELKIYE